MLTEYLIEKFPALNYTVADIPSVTLDFIKWKKANYGYSYEILVIGPGKAGIPLKDMYDLMICENVLEHTPNPIEIVESFIAHLSYGGVLLIDFINDVGGENLEIAHKQREDVKNMLKTKLKAIKAIDDRNVHGLYVNL